MTTISTELDLAAPRRGEVLPRPRRVVFLLAIIWVIGLSDLVFTLLARDLGHFAESNPIAAGMIQATVVLVIFKLTALILASAIFLRFRHHRFTELSCWCMCTVHLALALTWLSYYSGLE